MIASRVPLLMVAKIVGWALALWQRWLQGTDTIGIEKLRVAVKAISSNSVEGTAVRAKSLEFSLHSEGNSGSHEIN